MRIVVYDKPVRIYLSAFNTNETNIAVASCYILSERVLDPIVTLLVMDF